MEHPILTIVTQALMAIVFLSLPTAGAALVVGLAVSVFQTATQVQEQTLSYLPKLIAVFAALALSGRWMAGNLVRFALTLFEQIPTAGSW